MSRQGSRAGVAVDTDRLSPSAVAACLLQDDPGTTTEDDLAAGDMDGVSGVAADASKSRNVDEVQDVYRVLVLGSQGVGKTTLVEQLMTSEYLANKDNSYAGQSVCLSFTHFTLLIG